MSLIHQGVGSLEHRLKIARRLLKHGDAHARRDWSVAGERIRHGAGDALAGLIGFASVDALQDYGEFVAAETGDGIGTAHRRVECPPHGDERGIAGRVSETVVELLEIIQIEVGQGQRLSVASRSGDLHLAEFHEGAPVAQARERVETREFEFAGMHSANARGQPCHEAVSGQARHSVDPLYPCMIGVPGYPDIADHPHGHRKGRSKKAMPESPRPRDQKDRDDRRACERELGVCSDASEAQEDNEQRGQRPSGDQSSTTGKHVKELHGLAQTPRYRYVRGASRAGTVTMERGEETH